MNTSIQDAFNLGWKLALVAKGLAPDNLLESFNNERLPVVKEMLNITDNLMKKTIADSDREEGWDRPGSIDQLGVNYRSSSIIVDEEDEELGCAGGNFSPYNAAPGGTLHAGDRAPDAPGLIKLGNQCSEDGEPTNLFKLFDLTRHTVLVFADKADCEAAVNSLDTSAPDLVRTIVISRSGQKLSLDADEVFEDRDEHAHSAYLGGQGKSTMFAVRPDGIVGARVRSIDGLQRYFKRVFEGLGIQ